MVWYFAIISLGVYLVHVCNLLRLCLHKQTRDTFNAESIHGQNEGAER